MRDVPRFLGFETLIDSAFIGERTGTPVGGACGRSLLRKIMNANLCKRNQAGVLGDVAYYIIIISVLGSQFMEAGGRCFIVA